MFDQESLLTSAEGVSFISIFLFFSSWYTCFWFVLNFSLIELLSASVFLFLMYWLVTLSSRLSSVTLEIKVDVLVLQYYFLSFNCIFSRCFARRVLWLRHWSIRFKYDIFHLIELTFCCWNSNHLGFFFVWGFSFNWLWRCNNVRIAEYWITLIFHKFMSSLGSTHIVSII